MIQNKRVLFNVSDQNRIFYKFDIIIPFFVLKVISFE